MNSPSPSAPDDSDSPASPPDEPQPFAIHDGVSYDVHNGLPFPESVDAFLYTAESLCNQARQLSEGMKVVIDNNRTPFTVVDTYWSVFEKSEYKAPTQFVTPEHTDLPDCGPMDDMDHLLVLEQPMESDAMYTLTTPGNDLVAPLLNKYEGDDLPRDASLAHSGVFQPVGHRKVSRVERPPQPAQEITAGREARAHTFLSTEIRTEGTRPISDLSQLDQHPDKISDSDDRREIPSLPNEFVQIGRCPDCTKAVVEDQKRERVVCVGCRRWTPMHLWNDYATQPFLTKE